MTDYQKNTGGSGKMMIRVNNPTVEFWLTNQGSSTYAHELPWGYTVNGSTNNDRQVDYGQDDGWKKLGSWSVTSDQTVTFRIFDTGTSGFGGPTTLSVSIDRAAAPDAPSKPTISEITANSMRVKWNSGDDNGASIDNWQTARNTANTTSGATVFNVDRDTTFTGLNAATTYYYWARTHNAKGYSPWSSVASAKTLSAPPAPFQPITTGPSQTTFDVSFQDNGGGGLTITGRQIAYNITNSTTGATIVTYNNDVLTITGLQPATTYYVWGRVQNAAGWGAWSPVATERTIAGAWINVGGEWKEAIPYVHDSGSWKLARPWGRDAGVWKETT